MEEYCCYANIDTKHFIAFEKLWDTYDGILPKIKPVLQDEAVTKINVFNIWLNYYVMDDMLFIKTERAMLNSIFSNLVNKIKKHTPYESVNEIEHQKKNELFIFLYAYYMLKYLYEQLGGFVQTHKFLKDYRIHRTNLYNMEDDDVEQGDIVYIILKIINFEYIQMHLTQNRCFEAHLMALYFTKSFLNHHALRMNVKV